MYNFKKTEEEILKSQKFGEKEISDECQNFWRQYV